MMVMNLFQDMGSQDGGHLGTDPITARISIASGKLHRGHIFLAFLAIHGQQHRIDMDSFSTPC